MCFWDVPAYILLTYPVSPIYKMLCDGSLPFPSPISPTHTTKEQDHLFEDTVGVAPQPPVLLFVSFYTDSFSQQTSTEHLLHAGIGLQDR